MSRREPRRALPSSRAALYLREVTRFQSRYDLRGLIDVVAAIARIAEPAEPERVTQRRYDAARAKAGYPDAPSARQTATRLKMPWPELVALALSGRDLDKSLGYRFGEHEEHHFGEEDLRSALRVVALRLGKKSLSYDDYAAERARMLADARRRWLHRSTLSLPSGNQIKRVAGSWDAALAIAGLVPPPKRTLPRGIPIVEALELALEAHGALLTRVELDRFAAANGLSLARPEKGKPWADYLAELRTRRAEWGKWTPTAPPVEGVRPDYGQAVSLPAGLPQRKKRRWSREECVAAIARLLGELPSNERLTLRVYLQKANVRPELPALGSLQRHADFTELVAEARLGRNEVAPHH
jgi:hypothetical protein